MVNCNSGNAQKHFCRQTFHVSNRIFAPVETACEPDSQWSSCTFIVWKRADLTLWLLLCISYKFLKSFKTSYTTWGWVVDDKMNAFCHHFSALAFKIRPVLRRRATWRNMEEVQSQTHLCQSSKVPLRFLIPVCTSVRFPSHWLLYPSVLCFMVFTQWHIVSVRLELPTVMLYYLTGLKHTASAIIMETSVQSKEKVQVFLFLPGT